MSMLRIGFLLAAAFVITLAPASAEDRQSAENGFRLICAVAADEKGDALEQVLPAKLIDDERDWRSEDVEAWRKGFALELAKANVISVSEAGDLAFVRYRGRSRKTEKVIRLRYGEDRWSIDCPQSYKLTGSALRKANGRRPATCTLSARRKQGPYEGSAFSFAHVTKDPEACKNRMDLWFCVHGDLHMVRGGRIAAVGSTKLADVEAPEAGWDWKEWIAPVEGTTYVMRCYRRGHRDFYIRLRVESVTASSLEFTWSLLAGGPGAPATIHSTTPIETMDGADGFDGMCGGKM